MTSVYVKCDGVACAAVVDRVAPGDPAGQPDGTFGRYGGQDARAYAARFGWVTGIKRDDNPHDYGQDFCPCCAEQLSHRHIDKDRQLADLKITAEAFRRAMIESGAVNHVRQTLYFDQLRCLERALNDFNYVQRG